MTIMRVHTPLKLWLATAIFLLSCHAALQHRPAYPSFVRLSLAGEDLLDGAPVKYDPKAHYYLIHTGDADGCSLDLILSPNPYGGDPGELATDKNTLRVSLPRLRNGTGVNIGETPQQVQKKLGSPPTSVGTENNRRAREWIYLAAKLRIGGRCAITERSISFAMRGSGQSSTTLSAPEDADVATDLLVIKRDFS